MKEEEEERTTNLKHLTRELSNVELLHFFATCVSPCWAVKGTDRRGDVAVVASERLRQGRRCLDIRYDWKKSVLCRPKVSKRRDSTMGVSQNVFSVRFINLEGKDTEVKEVLGIVG